MARGSDQAKQGATSAQNLSNTMGANSSALFGQLAPELEAQAAHPAGISPQDQAAMGTAAQQSGGGSMAGAVGQGALKAARTRNAGASDAAIQESTRTAGRQASEAALKPELADIGMKADQQKEALGGLGNLYGQNSAGSIGALGQVAGNVNADTNAQNASYDWAKYLLDPALSAAGQSAASFAKGS
jgi:hypothetical protein